MRREHIDTALHLTVYNGTNGYVGIVAILITCRANLETRNDHGKTALKVAALLKQTEIVNVLKAGPQFQKENGRFPMPDTPYSQKKWVTILLRKTSGKQSADPVASGFVPKFVGIYVKYGIQLHSSLTSMVVPGLYYLTATASIALKHDQPVMLFYTNRKPASLKAIEVSSNVSR